MKILHGFALAILLLTFGGGRAFNPSMNMKNNFHTTNIQSKTDTAEAVKIEFILVTDENDSEHDETFNVLNSFKTNLFFPKIGKWYNNYIFFSTKIYCLSCRNTTYRTTAISKSDSEPLTICQCVFRI